MPIYIVSFFVWLLPRKLLDNYIREHLESSKQIKTMTSAHVNFTFVSYISYLECIVE